MLSTNDRQTATTVCESFQSLRSLPKITLSLTLNGREVMDMASIGSSNQLVLTQASPFPQTKHIRTTSWSWTPIRDILENYTSSDLECWSELDYKRDNDGYHNLVESIRTIGFLWPVLVTRSEGYSNGHHRLAACIDLGYSYIPTTTDNSECGWNGDEESDNSTGPDFWNP